MTDAEMSTVMVPYTADKCLIDSGAIDSMCHTLRENQPWWTASTADNALYDITSVIVREARVGLASGVGEAQKNQSTVGALDP